MEHTKPKLVHSCTAVDDNQKSDTGVEKQKLKAPNIQLLFFREINLKQTKNPPTLEAVLLDSNTFLIGVNRNALLLLGIFSNSLIQFLMPLVVVFLLTSVGSGFSFHLKSS